MVRLPVEALALLGLTVVPEEDPGGPPGHAVIPQLNFAEYERDKHRLKDVLLELARLGTQAIALEPEVGP